MSHRGREPGAENQVLQANGEARPPRSWYCGRELAEQILGISYQHFYHHPGVSERYHAAEGLPRPYCTKPMRWDKATVDAWKRRHHPSAVEIPTPANDRDAPAMPGRAELARHYGAARRGA